MNEMDFVEETEVKETDSSTEFMESGKHKVLLKRYLPGFKGISSLLFTDLVLNLERRTTVENETTFVSTLNIENLQKSYVTFNLQASDGEKLKFIPSRMGILSPLEKTFVEIRSNPDFSYVFEDLLNERIVMKSAPIYVSQKVVFSPHQYWDSLIHFWGTQYLSATFPMVEITVLPRFRVLESQLALCDEKSMLGNNEKETASSVLGSLAQKAELLDLTKVVKYSCPPLLNNPWWNNFVDYICIEPTEVILPELSLPIVENDESNTLMSWPLTDSSSDDSGSEHWPTLAERMQLDRRNYFQATLHNFFQKTRRQARLAAQVLCFNRLSVWFIWIFVILLAIIAIKLFFFGPSTQDTPQTSWIPFFGGKKKTSTSKGYFSWIPSFW